MERKATFDYGNLKKEHKEAAEEIIKICESQGNFDLANLLKKNFDIVVRPVFDLSTTEMFKYCKEVDIFLATHGLIVDSDSEMDYPVVGICDDIRKIEKLISIIKDSK
jgi:hypothetical protein